MANESDRAMTDFGRELVRLRGLFAGETAERASWWVSQIEQQAVDDYKSVLRAFRAARET